jgi:diaminopimelate epimerase
MMARFPFWKITPGGNPTILLRAEDIPSARRAAVAHAVMDSQHLGAEQTGYIRLCGKPRLDMMGGEFCLNATRSFAAVLAEEGLLTEQDGILQGMVEVSGISQDIPVRVVLGSTIFAEACLMFRQLPSPEYHGNVRLVRVPGIAHIIQYAENASPLSCFDDKSLREFCSAQRLQCGVENEDAVGHLWLAEDAPHNDTQRLILHPAVWVRDTATLCRETACGSGTLACALDVHARTACTHFMVRQPSGADLSVRIEHDGENWKVWVGGSVRMTAQGMTDLTGIL